MEEVVYAHDRPFRHPQSFLPSVRLGLSDGKILKHLSPGLEVAHARPG